VFWILFGTIGYLALTDSAHTIVLLDMTRSTLPGGDTAALVVELLIVLRSSSHILCNSILPVACWKAM